MPFCEASATKVEPFLAGGAAAEVCFVRMPGDGGFLAMLPAPGLALVMVGAPALTLGGGELGPLGSKPEDAFTSFKGAPVPADVGTADGLLAESPEGFAGVAAAPVGADFTMVPFAGDFATEDFAAVAAFLAAGCEGVVSLSSGAGRFWFAPPTDPLLAGALFVTAPFAFAGEDGFLIVLIKRSPEATAFFLFRQLLLCGVQAAL